MIYLNRLHTQDLFSYHELDLNLRDRGLVLVEGENGSGKTSIFESILWTLFGETTKELKADDVIREGTDHKPIKGATHGYLELDCDGTKVEVWRHRKHKEHDNSMLLFVDGQSLKMGSDKETLKRLEGLIGYDCETWCKSVLFPQGGSKFVGLTDAQQKSILDRVFHVERFAEAQVRAKTVLKSLRDDLLKTTASRLELDSQLKQIIVDHQKAVADSEMWESSHAVKVAQALDRVKQLQSSYPTMSTVLSAKVEAQAKLLNSDAFVMANRAVKDATEKQAATKSLLDVAAVELRNLKQTRKMMTEVPDVPQPPTDITPQQIESAKAKTQTTINNLNADIAVIDNRVHRMEEVLKNYTGTCVMCGQPLDDEQEKKVLGDTRTQLAAHKVDRARLYDEYQKCNAILQNCEDLLHNFDNWEHNAAIRGLDLQIKEADTKCTDLLAKHEKMTADLAEAEKAFDQLNDLRVEYERLTKLLQAEQQAVADHQQKIALAQQAHVNEAAQVNPYIEQITRLTDQRARVSKRAEMVTGANMICRDQIQIHEFWEEGFGNSGMKSLLYSHLIPRFNERTNEYLRILSRGRFSVRFRTQSSLANGELRDKLDCEVLLNEGGGGYRKASGGEQRRIDLAALFALGDLAADRPETAIRLRLLDEPFDDLDGEGCEAVVQALNELVVPKSGTVMVMTHSDKLKSLIRQRIQVQKVRGTSFIK